MPQTFEVKVNGELMKFTKQSPGQWHGHWESPDTHRTWAVLIWRDDSRPTKPYGWKYWTAGQATLESKTDDDFGDAAHEAALAAIADIIYCEQHPTEE